MVAVTKGKLVPETVLNPTRSNVQPSGLSGYARTAGPDIAALRAPANLNRSINKGLGIDVDTILTPKGLRKKKLKRGEALNESTQQLQNTLLGE